MYVSTQLYVVQCAFSVDFLDIVRRCMIVFPPLQILENDENIEHAQSDPDGFTLDSEAPKAKKGGCC